MVTRNLIRPSYHNGLFARRAGESAHPERWRGLVGAWVPALGVTGNRLFDVSGRGNDGILTNMNPATDWIVGENGYVLDITGTGNDRIQVSNNGTGWAKNRNEVTIIIWVKIKTIASFDAVIGQGAFSSNYLHLYQSSNAWSAVIRSTNGVGGADRFSVISSTLGYLTTTDDTFHQVVMTVRFGDIGKLYSDTVEIGEDLFTTGNADFAGGGDLFFGSFSSGNGSDCEIAQVLMYDRVLTLSAIKDNFDDRLVMFERRSPISYFVPPAVTGIEVFRRRMEGY